jgi:hypothetical protein
MNTPRLPAWVAPICCVSPFLALIGFSINSALGGQVGSPALVCLVILCGKIISVMLYHSNDSENAPRIGERE